MLCRHADRVVGVDAELVRESGRRQERCRQLDKYGTVDDTPPGAPPLVITELLSINPGGTFIDTLSIAHSSQNPLFSGPFAPLAVDFGDAFGTWKQRGDDSNQFAITFKRLLFAGANTPTAIYGACFPGQHVGSASIQAVATLRHGEHWDTLTGPFTFQLTNLDGRVVLAASGTFSATRLKIEPLATPLD